MYEFVDTFDGIETYTPNGFLDIPFSNQDLYPTISPLIEEEFQEITQVALGLENSASFGLSLNSDTVLNGYVSAAD